MLVNLSLKTSVSSFLKSLSLCHAFILLLTLYCYGITSNFLINKLYAKGYLAPFAKQVTQTC